MKKAVRYFDGEGFAIGDVLFAEDEPVPERETAVSHNRLEYARVRTFPPGARSETLLHPVFRDGARVEPGRHLSEIRDFAQQQIRTLRPEVRRLRNPERYWVGLSTCVADEKAEAISRLGSV